MIFLDLVKKRRSVRTFSAQEIELHKINYLLEAARLSPSACNLQPWVFMVVTSPEWKQKLHACYNREWFKTAPMYILACSNRKQSWKRQEDAKDHADIDLAIAIEHICLAAAEQDLGSCWVCNFDPELLTQSFALEEGINPVAIIPIGYPAESITPKPTPRKPITEITTWH